jgi:hypothetical protein
LPTLRYAHSLHLPKRYWASLRCTSRCLFAKNAFEWIEQLLAVQDVVRTQPRPHSRGEIGPGFLFGGHMLDSLRNGQTGCRCFGYERPAASPGSGGSCLLLFLNRSSQSHRTLPPSSDGLHFRFGLHAARTARRVLNVPFQSSIRAWMLLQAARRARSFLCGECATRLSSSSLPIGP